MVALILVEIILITGMDNPEWLRENAEPYIFSRARYGETIEDLGGLGAEDPNTVQALVCNASISHRLAYSISDRTGMSFGGAEGLSTRPVQKQCSRSSSRRGVIPIPISK